MAKSITIRSIERRNGCTYVRVGKEETEIPGGKTEFREWIRERFSEETLLALGLAVYAARDPDFSNPGIVVGKTLTLDLTGRVNYPDAVVRMS